MHKACRDTPHCGRDIANIHLSKCIECRVLDFGRSSKRYVPTDKTEDREIVDQLAWVGKPNGNVSIIAVYMLCSNGKTSISTKKDILAVQNRPDFMFLYPS